MLSLKPEASYPAKFCSFPTQVCEVASLYSPTEGALYNNISLLNHRYHCPDLLLSSTSNLSDCPQVFYFHLLSYFLLLCFLSCNPNAVWSWTKDDFRKKVPQLHKLLILFLFVLSPDFSPMNS